MIRDESLVRSLPDEKARSSGLRVNAGGLTYAGLDERGAGRRRSGFSDEESELRRALITTWLPKEMEGDIHAKTIELASLPWPDSCAACLSQAPGPRLFRPSSRIVSEAARSNNDAGESRYQQVSEFEQNAEQSARGQAQKPSRINEAVTKLQQSVAR